MDIRFETGNDLTLEEVLFVQNSFHSNWRVKALDQLQFDEDAHSDDSQLWFTHMKFTLGLFSTLMKT